MRLDKFRFSLFRRREEKITLNTNALKKVLAVSDEHFEKMYEPIMHQFEQCTCHLATTKMKLYKDFIDQLVKALRRLKGRVQEDNKLLHAENYCTVLCFTAYYLATLLNPYEFYKETSQGKVLVHLWLVDCGSNTLAVKKKKTIHRIRSLLMPIANQMLLSNQDVLQWLMACKKPLIEDVHEFIVSGGEDGRYSQCLAGFSNPLEIINKNSPVIESNIDVELIEKNQKQEQGTEIESLLQSNTPEFSLEDLLSGVSTSEDSDDSKCNPFKRKTDDDDVVSESDDEEMSELDQLSALLGSPDDDDDETETSNVSVLKVKANQVDVEPHQTLSLSDEIIRWCESKLDSLSDGVGDGYYAVNIDGDAYVAIELPIGVNSFIASDYSIEDEAQQDTVFNEILDDMAKGEWRKNGDKFLRKKVNVNGSIKEVITTSKIYENTRKNTLIECVLE